MDNIDWLLMKLLLDKKSLNKTAESLYMTQSAVSKRLQRIEAEWDIKVVKRPSKGVIFTPSGGALAHLSLTVLEGMDALRKRFRLQRCHKKGRGQQLLRFGITNSFARLNLSDLVSAYSKACDELSVHPILGSWDSNIKKLNEGSVDVAVCFDCHEAHSGGRRIFAEKLYLLMPRHLSVDGAAALPCVIGYHSTYAKNLIHEGLSYVFPEQHKDIEETSHVELAVSMVESGSACTLIFGEDWKVNRQQVKEVEIHDEKGSPVWGEVYLIWTQEAYRDLKIRRFINFTEAHFKSKNPSLGEST